MIEIWVEASNPFVLQTVSYSLALTRCCVYLIWRRFIWFDEANKYGRRVMSYAFNRVPYTIYIRIGMKEWRIRFSTFTFQLRSMQINSNPRIFLLLFFFYIRNIGRRIIRILKTLLFLKNSRNSKKNYKTESQFKIPFFRESVRINNKSYLTCRTVYSIWTIRIIK